jgi:hypothetical protein
MKNPKGSKERMVTQLGIQILAVAFFLASSSFI